MDAMGTHSLLCCPIQQSSSRRNLIAAERPGDRLQPLQPATKADRGRLRRRRCSIEHQGTVQIAAGLDTNPRESNGAQGSLRPSLGQRRGTPTPHTRSKEGGEGLASGKWSFCHDSALELQQPSTGGAALEELTSSTCQEPEFQASTSLLGDVPREFESPVKGSGVGVKVGDWRGEQRGEDRSNGSTVQSRRCGPLRVLLIDNYDSYTYNLYHLIAQCNFGVPPLVLRNDAVQWRTLKPLLNERCSSASLAPGALQAWLTENNIHLSAEEPLLRAPSSTAPHSATSSSTPNGWHPSASPFLFDCIVISPGPGSPSIPSDIGVCMDVLKTCGHIPVFGVCMGHQALGVASGATVGLAPHPVHGQLSPVEHSGHPLFAGIPSGAGFEVVRYHSLVVDPESLPPHLEPIGWSTDLGILSPGSAGDSRGGLPGQAGYSEGQELGVSSQEGLRSDGGSRVAARSEEMIVMALAHKGLPHYGVQFHPESIETKHGHQLLSNFLDLAASFWKDGQKELHPSVGRSPELPDAALCSGAPSAQAVMGPFQVELPIHLQEPVQELIRATAFSSPCRLLSETEQHSTHALLSPAAQHHAPCQELPCLDPHTVRGTEGASELPRMSQQAGECDPQVGAPQGELSLRLTWEVVPGALRSVPGGAAGLFRRVFGDKEETAQDTFWLDSSTAESDLAQRTAPPQMTSSVEADSRAPRACWSTGTAPGGAPGESSTNLSRGVAPALAQPLPRFSFMGGVGGPLWRKVSYHLPPVPVPGDAGHQGGVLQEQDCEGVRRRLQSTSTGIFEHLEQEMERWRLVQEQCRDLPFDFCGGFVGYLGYELKSECGAARGQHESPHPDAFFFRVDRFLALDHSTGDVYVVGVDATPQPEGDETPNGTPCSPAAGQPCCSGALRADGSCSPLWAKHLGGESVGTTRHWVHAFTQDLRRTVGGEGSEDACKELRNPPEAGAPSRPADGNGSVTGAPLLQPRKQQDQYEAAVRECQAHILLGESYELCLTTQLEGQSHQATLHQPPGRGASPDDAREVSRRGGSRPEDALQFYMNLRKVSPAPYGGWLSGAYTMPQYATGGSDGSVDRGAGGAEEVVVLCCSSPERFLRLDEAGVLEAKPIKGTRPRGSTAEEDQHLADSLRTNVKDRAENLMIVDLLRNDLGRVSTIGSVRVPSLMAIESYAFVHQLVSTVQSNLHPSVSPVAAVRAAFPGGSMTGAPKIRSMQLLDKIECCARGPYSGALGYFSFNGTFSFNIVIRTAVLSRDRISVGAGGAVIALSDPTSEYVEMLLKSRSVERALTSLQQEQEQDSEL